MERPKLYFDTTIPNYLFGPARPDRMEATWRLWERCAAEEYEVFVSDVFFRELDRCPEPKRGMMYGQLGRIGLGRLEESDEARELAAAYIRNGVLGEQDFNDCLHIASAVVSGCDVILSWNFRHIVNDGTKGKARVVNSISRYNEIGIASPDDFLMGDR
jgi:predicted nucleic acid-binding protein